MEHMPTRDYYAGIDLGGTKILVLITDDAGNVLGDTRVPTLAHEGVEAVIGRLVQATIDAAAEAKVEMTQIRAVTVALGAEDFFEPF